MHSKCILGARRSVGERRSTCILGEYVRVCLREIGEVGGCGKGTGKPSLPA